MLGDRLSLMILAKPTSQGDCGDAKIEDRRMFVSCFGLLLGRKVRYKGSTESILDDKNFRKLTEINRKTSFPLNKMFDY